MELLTDEAFRPHIGATFEINLDDGSKLQLVLADIKMLAARKSIPEEILLRIGANADRCPFSLTFVGPHDIILPQRLYSLTQLESGLSEEIFLVPVGKDSEGVRYEAVFN